MTPSLINTCGNRFYRRYMGAGKNTVSLKYRDSDIWISYSSNKKILNTEFKTFLKNRLYELRNSLEDYCQKDNEFRDSLLPVGYRHNAPDMAKAMAELSFVSKVGPMAGVAGAFAMYLGRFCREEFDLESIIVENGGDLYISSPETVNAVLYAGENVLSGKLALSI